MNVDELQLEIHKPSVKLKLLSSVYEKRATILIMTEDKGMEPCCSSRSDDIWWCNICEIQLCDKCWDTQKAHSPKARGANTHQKSDLILAELIQSIIYPETNPEKQSDLHWRNCDTKWFGVFNDDKLGSPYFHDFGQYNRLVTGMSGSQYPSLTSFIGETGAGKSTLIVALMKIKANGDLAQVSTPVMGALMSGPTSGEVHLYADPQTYDQERPYFYADCEGFSGGNHPPSASTIVRGAQPLFAMLWARKREILWAKEGAIPRQWMVENLYPRFLFTFSDTICFVTKNMNIVEDVFSRLIMWADKVFEKSINQPLLPRAIIVVNAFEANPKDDCWDVELTTDGRLKFLQGCVKENPALKRLKKHWNTLGKDIETLKDLLLLYYSDVKIICIPHGRLPPNLIKAQYTKLYDEIKNSSDAAKSWRRQAGLLMTSKELGYYMESAFEHFSQNADKPFDFLAAAVIRNPVAQVFKDHVLKLAVLLMTLHPSWDGSDIFEKMSSLVASCILLNSKRRGYPQKEGLLSEYTSSCAKAQEEFYKKHWPCEQRDLKGRRCVNVSVGHSKGHQLSDGKVFGTGNYYSTFGNKMTQQSEVFLDDIKQEFVHLKDRFDRRELGSVGREAYISDAASFHQEHGLAPFITKYIPDTKSLESHKSCFGCLFETPIHVLYCGHVLCGLCITNFAKTRPTDSIEISTCPLCQSSWDDPWRIRLMPQSMGLRILSLDGGGIRGIFQLTILEILEERIDLDVPIQEFFDLIVGTSAGGLVGLGLGSNLMSVKNCKQLFRELCERGFRKRLLADVPLVKDRRSRYRTKELEKALQDAFEKKPIFGGDQKAGSPNRPKVGVTSTSTNGAPYFHANYNRAQSEGTPYVFLRGENHKEELEIWEAARASSAAPTYFKPFYHKKSGYTFNDGGLRYNNPVKVADTERKLLWPHLARQPPALLLSIGTGYDSTFKADENIQGPKPQSGTFGHVKGLVKIVLDQVQTSLNCQLAWKDFTSHLDLENEDLNRKYCRLNLDYGKHLPKLDDVAKMTFMERTAKDLFSHHKLIDQVADTLIASLFYFHQISTRKSQVSGTRWDCEGKILCQFSQGSSRLKKLCGRLRSLKQGSDAPLFEMKERPVADCIIPYPDDKFFNEIEFDNSPFALPVKLSVHEGEPSRIYLRLAGNRKGLIGGFPRSLVPVEYPQAPELRTWSFT